MGTLGRLGQGIIDWLGETNRRFTAFVFMVYAVGVVVGSLVTQHRPDLSLAAVVVPLALAFLAYINNVFAIVSLFFFTLIIFLL